MPSAKGKKKESFESSLAKLEKVVNQLEEGELSLEEAIKAFQTGTKLAKTCEGRLAEARKKIEVLMGEQVKDFQWEDKNEPV
jgi:exodeoxyribonuclease VII small subunit